MTVKDRIAAIQARLGLKADGLIGPVTLTAIEKVLDEQLGEQAATPRLSCSTAGLKKLVEFECSSAAYYNRFLKHPTWPGGASGVTIGIGYDLGYCSAAQARRDWRGRVSDDELAELEKVCRLKGIDAKAIISVPALRDVTVGLDAASEVFYQSSLPAYADKCIKAYPGVTDLPADAQTAILSLVYNRGTAKSGSKRKEMKAIGPLIQQGDLAGIADQIISMKRLWENSGLGGLLRRRDDEADLVRGARRDYSPDELVRI